MRLLLSIIGLCSTLGYINAAAILTTAVKEVANVSSGSRLSLRTSVLVLTGL
jgi:hypothetical protein